MSLKKKQTENRKKLKQAALLCSVFVIFFAAYASLAKYELASVGSVKIGVANWNIKLNGEELTSSSQLDNSIQFFIDSAKDYGSPEPGESGHFDITIDPAGTEVSFAYQVALDKRRLPARFSVASYSLNGGARIDLPEGANVEGQVFLNGKTQFTAEDAQTIRYYWRWDEPDAGTKENCGIDANVEVKQILSGPESEPEAE